MGYLIRTVETYRVANESEAKKIIEEAKANKSFTLSKYSSEKKNQKAKGEIVDEWMRVILTKDFNEEKEPYANVDVIYDVEVGCFPPSKNEQEEE